MLRELNREELELVSGAGEAGQTKELYRDADGLWELTFNADGSFAGETLLSGGYDPGLFGCIGGGLYGGVGGACIGTNPFDAYVYSGIGTPGIDVQVGVATNTSEYLTGEGSSAGALVNVGQTANGEHGAISISDPVPSASHTYGYSVSGMVSDAADAFSEAGRQFSQWTYDQVGRPYDAPDQ